MITSRLRVVGIVTSIVAISVGCSSSGSHGESGSGALRANLVAASAHDIAEVHYTVVPAGQNCDDPPVAQAAVALESEAFPSSSGGSGANHRFADAFFTLSPGAYTVCVTPLQASGEPSTECGAAEAQAMVVAGATSEVALISQCKGDARGGLDATTLLNDPPFIEDLAIAPSKFIRACEAAALHAELTDANGDDLVTKWEVASAPEGANAAIAGSGNTVTFRSDMTGAYELRLVVTDAHDATAMLSFPIYVSGQSCNDGNSCNGVEVCSNDDQCLAGQPEPDGATCTAACGSGAVCQAGACICADSSTAVIPADGGTVTLGDRATVTFPSDAFASPQPVVLSATSNAETALDWQVSAEMFAAGARTAYELRLDTGTTRPQAGIRVVLDVPSDFAARVPADSEIQVFAQLFQDAGGEALDQFELFASVYSAAESTVTVELPAEAFTNRRNARMTYEAVFLLATTPTRPGLPLARTSSAAARTGEPELPLPPPPDAVMSDSSAARPFAAAAAATCEGSSLGSPLANREVTSPFNAPSHYGTDYRAADGTTVQAMADGKIVKIGFDERPLPTPDPRSGKTVKGWGRYVIIEHSDGSRSLYAHLQKDGVQQHEGDSVSEGDAIALSDNTGGSSGPHLHVEYAPNGKIYERASKVDPDPCIDQNARGSITVSDNGNLADDAFSVAINGLVVCTTTIGASNTCAVGNLRAGNATLTLTVVVAPDNVGTYQITLADGLTFSDSSTTRSGTAPQGGTASFPILIPKSPSP